MHIGVLSTGYPHDGSPSAGAFVRAMCVALALRGHSLTVLCAELPGSLPLRDSGVTVVPLKYLGARTFYRAGAPDNLRAEPIAALVGAADFTARLCISARERLKGCDALISHFALPCGLVGAIVRAGRAHLLIVHGSDGWLLSKAPKMAQRALLSGATQLQFTHQALCDSLAHTKVTSTVRPMGVEWPEHQPESDVSEANVFRLLTVSRLCPVKRVHLAIALAHALASRGLPVELTVAGDGPSRDALNTMAQRGPCPVRFVGAVNRSARERLMFASTLMLHTAGELPDGRTEGAPVVLLEAMACGLPVLCTEAGGVRDVVGDAAVVSSTHELELRATELLLDTAKRAQMSRRGREIAWELRWEAESARIEAALFKHP